MEGSDLKKLKPRQSKKMPLILSLIGVVFALALVGYAVWQFLPQYKATNNPNPTVSNTVVTHSTDQPDETNPEAACKEYQTQGTVPERLAIPKLNVTGCIESVGVDQHGAVAVPTNIYTAGWFVDSAKPGEPGLSIIDGHINGNFTNDGIFQHLESLVAGDRFTVERGDGTILNYEVVSVDSVPLDDAAKKLFAHDTSIKSQLNLITCGGRWNESIQQFDHRIIAVAKLVD